MTVDFGNGESTVVYGDNGTGKSTIADALEWYFTGEIELLSHEGRQHAVRYVGGDDDGRHIGRGAAPAARSAGKVVFPDERTPDMFEALRRETFLLRGRTLADFINKTKTEKWKALVEILGLDAIESLREDLQRARNDLRKTSKAADEEVRVYRRALASGRRHGERGQRCSPISSKSARCSVSIHRNRWIRLSSRRGSRQPLAPVPAFPLRLTARVCWPKSRALKAPDFDKSVFEAWNDAGVIRPGAASAACIAGA